MTGARRDTWSSGDAYEPYVGRWSRLVAREFVGWLGLADDLRWLDVGCGTGALTGDHRRRGARRARSSASTGPRNISRMPARA